MQKYIGIKIIAAQPMNRANYNMYRGWHLPENENGLDEGYLIEYLDGGKANHPQHDGYISWSPAEQFDNAYRLTNGISFGLAVESIKKGHTIARTGWNGNAMFVFYVLPTVDGDGVVCRAHMMIMTVDGSIATWVPSESDVLADDWTIIS